MELSKQVCTYEQSKKLKLLGIRGSGKGCSWRKTTFTTAVFYGYVPVNGLRAFTVAELGVMLPAAYDTMRIRQPDGFRGYDNEGNDFPETDNIYTTEAECRAAMLITLLEKNIITAEEVNQRLKNA